MSRCAVIGGGIAGAGAAHYLSHRHDVVLLEAESTLAYHSTGRSAALLFDNYGPGPVRPLTAASRAFITDPPAGLADSPLISKRGAIWLARPDQMDSLDAVANEGRAMSSNIVELTPREIGERAPMVLIEHLAGGLLESDPVDLDVAGIHQALIRGARARGTEIRTGSRVEGLDRTDRGWEIHTGDDSLQANVIVNAAGAWGDQVAAMAGVRTIGLIPKRRTAFMVAGSADWAACPMVIDVDHEFYFKPDGAQLLCSPADETPVEPGDCQPDPLDVARAIERINKVTTLGIRSVRSEWAGLRTFAPDGSMVIGPDPAEPSFFWLVGQGGTGIQTAPAAGELVAGLVDDEVPSRLLDAGVDPASLSPHRPGLRAA